MEYLAKKSFSFLQDCAFTSIIIETYTNIMEYLLFCKILHLLVYDIYILCVVFF